MVVVPRHTAEPEGTYGGRAGVACGAGPPLEPGGPPIQAIWLYSATARAGVKEKIRKRVGRTNRHKAMLESHYSRVRKRS